MIYIISVYLIVDIIERLILSSKSLYPLFKHLVITITKIIPPAPSSKKENIYLIAYNISNSLIIITNIVYLLHCKQWWQRYGLKTLKLNNIFFAYINFIKENITKIMVLFQVMIVLLLRMTITALLLLCYKRWDILLLRLLILFYDKSKPFYHILYIIRQL